MNYVVIECSCGRKVQVSAEQFGFTPKEFKVDVLGDYLTKLRCQECHTPATFIFNERDQLLFDLTNVSYCSTCEVPLSIARLNSMPGTALCTLCVQEGADDIRTPPPHPQPPSEFSKCPTCDKYGRNSRTEMRQNGSDKSWFIGCSIYPKCRWTKNL
jgi:ssDNA-binding Zn-finger/Zn-ribbon topoisomerase 1